MIIVGARGFAKELLENFYGLDVIDNIVFFDNVSTDLPTLMFDRFPILRTEHEVLEHFGSFNNFFSLGVGAPAVRKKLYQYFTSIGGKPYSSISTGAKIGHFNTKVGEGVSIMNGTTITNDVFIGDGTLINLHCTIGHDCHIGEFCELSPGSKISGNVKLGNGVFIGTNATILPNVTIGNNVVVGAGAVVTKDIPDNTTVRGVPAIVIN